MSSFLCSGWYSLTYVLDNLCNMFVQEIAIVERPCIIGRENIPERIFSIYQDGKRLFAVFLKSHGWLIY